MKTPVMFLLLSVSTVAYAISPDDYAYGIPLRIDGNSALYEMPVPDAVYRHSVRPSLADVRIFDAAGQSVPFRIERPQAQEPATGKRRLSLSLFPVQSNPGSESNGNDLKIEFGDNRRIKTITSKTATNGDTRTSYIIDTGQLEPIIEELVFSVASDDASFVQPVRIDTGDDLHNWRNLVRRATLARLQHDGQTLERLSVDVSRQPADYLRVHLLGEQAITLQAVTAVVHEPPPGLRGIGASRSDGSGGGRWQGRYFQGRMDPENHNVFHYDLEAVYPVERLNLRFGDTNTLALARFESRADEETDWRLRRQARVFAMSREGMALRNDDIAIRPRSDRYWRVTLRNAGQLPEAPALFARWQSHRLVFLGRGEGPFVLAYGRAADRAGETGNSVQLLDTSLPDSMRPGSVTVAGQPYALGGEERLRSQRSLINWRTLGLWSVLILAVVMLGYMALRLFRDINSRSSE